MVNSNLKRIDYDKLSEAERAQLFKELGIPEREMDSRERGMLEWMLTSAREQISKDLLKHPEMSTDDPHCYDFWAGALRAVWTKPEFEPRFKQLFIGSFCVFVGDQMRKLCPGLEYFVLLKGEQIDLFGLVDRDSKGRFCRVFNLLGVTLKHVQFQEGKDVSQIIPYWIKELKGEVLERENN